MANFLQAHKITMSHEGGWANNPADSGGMTYKGIAYNFNPGWPGWLLVSGANKKHGGNAKLINAELAVNQNLQNSVLQFYKQNYWDVNHLDQVINQRIASELYDTGVNMGVGTAAQFVQRSLNLLNNRGRLYPDIDVDGKIGPVTLDLINSHPNPTHLLICLNGFQFMRYADNAEKKESQEQFMNSWLGRVSFSVL